MYRFRSTGALAGAALLAALASPALHAGSEHPRDSGVGCTRADNRYCMTPSAAAQAPLPWAATRHPPAAATTATQPGSLP